VLLLFSEPVKILKTTMQCHARISMSLFSLLLAGVIFSGAGAQDQSVQTDQPPTGQAYAQLTDQQIRELTTRVLNNQHRNDMALEQYMRTEHDQLRGRGVTSKETLVRIVPTGTGEAKVELKRDGMLTDPTVQEEQGHAIKKALSANCQPDDPEVKKDYERAAKREHERAEIVDAVGKAFFFHYIGREVIGGQKLLVLSFDPDPSYHSSIRYSSITGHVHGKVWVNESSAQAVRIEAELFDDYSLAGGLLAKVYSGSGVILEQSEIEPGVWLPTHFTYDITGRKLVFAITMHDQTETTEYRRVGPPREALQAISMERPEQALENAKNQR
jgi:hypothetical protein